GAGRAAFPRSYPHRRAAGGSLPHRRLRGRADTSREQGAEGRSSAQREEPSMTAAAPALDLSGQRSASWPSLLREIFAPTPGRFNATIRIVVATAIVLATSMTLEVPSIALSLFIVIYLTKLTSGVTTQNSVVVAVAGAAAIVVLTLAVALTILIFRFTFDQPPLRLAAMALFFFLGMFMQRVFAVEAVGFIGAIVVLVTQAYVDLFPGPESAVRGVLWVWVVL